MTRKAAVVAFSVAAALALGGCGSSPSPTATDDPGAQHTQATGGSPAAGVKAVAWPTRTLVRRLRGRTIEVAGRRVAVDPATLTCQGVGRAQRRGHALTWTRFHCVQPTFPARAVAGPDAVFDVHPTGPRSVRIAGARFVRY